MKDEPITIDFETDAIAGRPAYPPKPVGFSIRHPGERRSTYHAWGHPVGNTTTKREATAVLRGAYRSGLPLLFHNGKFDIDVAETHMGMPTLPWHRYHDTMFLLFLHDPHARELSLKPAAQKLLGMEPEERDAVRDWLEQHGIVRKKQKDWGAYISLAPGDVVGPYANGDVDRTIRIYRKLEPEIRRRGMNEAYDRERQLMPILLRNEREGIRTDVRGMERDLVMYEVALARTDAWLRKRLKAKDLNVDSDQDLADALERCRVVTDWVYTAPTKRNPQGVRSTAKKNMTVDMFRDKRVAAALGYRGRLSTCLGTFMRPWLDMAREHGRIYTNWNQVRKTGRDDSGMAGARTGRLSSNPNFQNIPKDFTDKDDGYVHPDHIEVPPLPLMRKYVLPDVGGVLCHRDYNQQELRILAHFEDDKLLAEYNENPLLDVHTYVQTLINEVSGRDVPRRPVKILNFGIIYGMGLGKLAAAIGCDVQEAKGLKYAQQSALPGTRELNKALMQRGRDGDPIRTWGGREYYCEPPLVIDGRRQTFEYKLLNYLIQGSAADCSKQALINYDAIRREGRFLITVHDEKNCSVPKGAVKQEMALMREAMESVRFDLPMLTDGKTGPNWGSLKKFKEAA